MTNDIKFSVLMPVYHKENPQYFYEAIESIINQSLQPNEIIIVKDGPLTVDLDNVVENFKNKFPSLFKIIILEKNVGQGLARNEGLKAASYNYVALMDSDDISLPNRFEKQINYLKNHPEIDVIGSNITEFENTPDNIISKKVVPLTHEEIYKFGKWRSPINNMTVIYKKNKVFEVGGYNLFNFGEDYLLFAKMLNAGMIFHNLEDCLVNARSGQRMLAKRVGFKRILQEMNLFYQFYRMKYINLFELIRNISLKFLLRIIPNWLRSYIYRRFLRKKV